MAIVDPQPQELGLVVAGLTAFVMQFDGPATARIGGTYYETLCSQGLKPEGAAMAFWGWVDAIEMYAAELAKLIAVNKGKQLAWRYRPTLETDGVDRFAVRSRLAFI